MKLTNLYHAVLGTVVLVLALHVWQLTNLVTATRDWVAEIVSDTIAVDMKTPTPKQLYLGAYEGITQDDVGVASSLADVTGMQITGPGKISICGSPCTHEVTHKETYNVCDCCGVRLLTISKEGKND